jgi:flagellar biosynthesis protein FlhA
MKQGPIATYGFAVVMLAIVMALIVPLPPQMLDFFLAINVLASALVLLTSITIHDPLEFAAFAPALLVATLFRLALDFSATRMILLQGHLPEGVGKLIPAFGQFVVGGSVFVGIVSFAILITIQFIVIASGSQRVAEVAARFTLDAMPGKQMAIDADVHAGALDMEGARKKRALVQKEADFYGAMDGAGKFVKGDAIAAIVIVVISILGGIVAGVVHGMSVGDAFTNYALLSIGNALLTTIPAFLMSISMGMMVTRVAADSSLGADLAVQVLRRPDVLRAVAILAFIMACVPALPQVIFLFLGLLLVAASYLGFRQQSEVDKKQEEIDAQTKRSEARRPENALGLVGVDAIAIEFGADLMGMLSPENGEALLDRISEVRRVLAVETGIVIPGVRIRDEASREPLSYAIRVRDELVAVGTLRINEFLAVGKTSVLDTIPGEATRDPVFGLPAKWIPVTDRETAISRGALVFDPISIIGSHLAEVCRNHAAQLFGRQELHTLIEHLKKTVPIVVKDVGTDVMPLATLHKAFVTLLRERVWPRDPVVTIEAMLEAAATSRDPRDLAEAARKVLIPPMLRRRNIREMSVLMFDPEFEKRVTATWMSQEGMVPEPQLALYIRERVEQYMRTVPPGRATILCTSAFRRVLSDLLERFNIAIDVFAFGELPADVDVRPVAIVAPPPGMRTSAIAS